MALNKLETVQSNLWGELSYGIFSNNLTFDKIILTSSSGESEVLSYDELCKQRFGMGMVLISKVLGVKVKTIHESQLCAFCTHVENYTLENKELKIKMINPVMLSKVLPVREGNPVNGISPSFISFKDVNLNIDDVVEMRVTLRAGL